LLLGGPVWLRLGVMDKNILIDKRLQVGYFFIALSYYIINFESERTGLVETERTFT
jgi:hypothetical protein